MKDKKVENILKSLQDWRGNDSEKAFIILCAKNVGNNIDLNCCMEGMKEIIVSSLMCAEENSGGKKSPLFSYRKAATLITLEKAGLIRMQPKIIGKKN